MRGLKQKPRRGGSAGLSDGKETLRGLGMRSRLSCRCNSQQPPLVPCLRNPPDRSRHSSSPARARIPYLFGVLPVAGGNARSVACRAATFILSALINNTVSVAFRADFFNLCPPGMAHKKACGLHGRSRICAVQPKTTGRGVGPAHGQAEAGAIKIAPPRLAHGGTRTG
jgi:hypothetical protein